MKVYLNSLGDVFFVNLITKNYMFTFKSLEDREYPRRSNLRHCLPRPKAEKLINMSPIAFFKAYKLLGGKLCKPREY